MKRVVSCGIMTGVTAVPNEECSFRSDVCWWGGSGIAPLEWLACADHIRVKEGPHEA